ncbi:MAG: glycosyltransferase family 39 protein [Elusimicrobiota bacterium]
MRGKESYALIIVLGLLLGLSGIRWGIPEDGRLRRILPPGLHGPQFHAELISAWEDIHRRLGPNLMLNPESFATFSQVQDAPAGWQKPPRFLYNAVRSFHVRSVHDDEQSVFLALSKMRPRRLDFNPHFFTYGGVYIYGVGAWLGVGALLGAVDLHSSLLPYLNEPVKMGGMYFWGRLLSVGAYIGCGLMLFALGRTFLRRRAALLAAVLFMLSPAVVVQAHTMKQHSLWTFLSFATLYLCLRVRERGGWREYLAAGAVAGLTVGAALNAWPTCLYIAAAALLRTREKPARWRTELLRLAAAAAASVAVFFATNPYWLLDYAHAYQEFVVLTGYTTANLLSPVRIFTGSFRHAVTTPVFLLICAGIAWALTSGRRNQGALLCLCAFFVMLAASVTSQLTVGMRQIRYFLPIVGTGALLAAGCADDLLLRFPRWRRTAVAGLALVVANVGMAGALYALNFQRTSAPGSNHYRAGDWIAAQVPAGAVIGMLRDPAPSNSAYFPLYRYGIRLIPPELFGTLEPERLPDYLVLSVPDYGQRESLEPNLSREFEPAAEFLRPRLAWSEIQLSATTANPPIMVYRRKAK